MLAADGSFNRPNTSNPAARNPSTVRNRWFEFAFAGTPSITSKRLPGAPVQRRRLQQLPPECPGNISAIN
jgi:hypothetical protein